MVSNIITWLKAISGLHRLNSSDAAWVTLLEYYTKMLISSWVTKISAFLQPWRQLIFPSRDLGSFSNTTPSAEDLLSQVKHYCIQHPSFKCCFYSEVEFDCHLHSAAYCLMTRRSWSQNLWSGLLRSSWQPSKQLTYVSYLIIPNSVIRTCGIIILAIVILKLYTYLFYIT
jgi:hypothetical protein